MTACRAMIADCSALIMAGGDSRRMGSDKTQIVLGEQTLVERAIGSVTPLFAQVFVSVRRYRPEIAWPQVCDAYPDAGPLAGICSGLAHATTRWVFALAADMPFVAPALIAALAERRQQFDAVVPVVHGYLQPLAAFYSISGLDRLQAVLAGGERNPERKPDGLPAQPAAQRGLRFALEQLNVVYVDQAELLGIDPTLRSFFDLDTPQDLAAARVSQMKGTP